MLRAVVFVFCCLQLTAHALDYHNMPPQFRIFEAVSRDSAADIAKAIDAGADINQMQPGSPSGQTPLMKAVLTGKLAAVKFLLQQGADTSIGEKDGYTPMHGAGFQGRAAIAQVLLEHGLSVDDRHSDGHTALQRACWGSEERHAATARVMLEA